MEYLTLLILFLTFLVVVIAIKNDKYDYLADLDLSTQPSESIIYTNIASVKQDWQEDKEYPKNLPENVYCNKRLGAWCIKVFPENTVHYDDSDLVGAKYHK